MLGCSVYWNGSYKGEPVLPPPVACSKLVEAGTGLVYAVHYCKWREGKPPVNSENILAVLQPLHCDVQSPNESDYM